MLSFILSHAVHRKEFSSYLCRPDHKQEFITQWQDSYNSLELHLRHEDVMKEELHHRVDVSLDDFCSCVFIKDKLLNMP